MGGLTWLHLSDWHQGSKDFDRQVVRDALISDIKNRTDISQNLEKIDFIVFSGDVAFSGKPDEYEFAKEELFEPLLKACNLSSEKLFIVPGNHDLDRDKFELLPASLSRPLESEIEAKKWLFDSEKRSEALKPFKAPSKRIQLMPTFENGILMGKKSRYSVLTLLGCAVAARTQKIK